jgi:large subunit ribosomal protein L17
MRHRKSGVKLNRTTSHRQAMFRNMVTSLLKYDRIKTTEAKAKELRRWADHIVTLAKRGDLHARRLAMSIVREKDVVHKIFEEAPKRFGSSNGGYTRIIKIGRRPGDAAAMTLVELISSDEGLSSKPKKTKAKVKADTAPAAPVPPSSEKATAAADAKASTVDDAPAESVEIDTAPERSDSVEELEKDSPVTAPKESDDPAVTEK